MPEQFTDNAWRSMLRQTIQSTAGVPLTWGHGGPVICTTRGLDVVFAIYQSVGTLMGLEFQARLPASEIGRRVLADGAGGLGVSIGYRKARQWITERDGVGAVRVVDDCVLDHVAVLPPATLNPCFEGARCYSGTGRWLTCPVALRDRARLDAYAVLKRQAGVRG